VSIDTKDATCGGCNGQCCYAYRVPVTGSDVQRLSRGLLVPAETVVSFLPAEPGDRGAMRLDGSDQRWSLHLLRREDGGCTLLVRLLDGTDRCGVYEHRPTACRTYPACLRGGVALREDHVCPPHLCGFLDTPGRTWWEALMQSEAEWDLYDAVTAVWDARIEADPPVDPVAPGVYFAWLAEVYGRIDELWADLDPAEQREQVPEVIGRAAQIAAAV